MCPQDLRLLKEILIPDGDSGECNMILVLFEVSAGDLTRCNLLHIKHETGL